MGKEKILALTFDDGPNETSMPEVMRLLDRFDAKATFFVIGSKINERTAPVLHSAVEQGYEIGNHSESHLHLPELNIPHMLHEIMQVQGKVEQATGGYPKLLRPPYLDVNSDMLRLVPMPFIFGQSNLDWDPEVSVAERIDRALRDARDGAILLMHCFEEDNAVLDVLEKVLPELKRQGFRITTVSGLFQAEGISLEPGRIYETAVCGEEIE